jgi:hypothetical protein
MAPDCFLTVAVWIPDRSPGSVHIACSLRSPASIELQYSGLLTPSAGQFINPKRNQDLLKYRATLRIGKALNSFPYRALPFGKHN